MRIWIVHQHAIPPIKMGPTRHYDLAKKIINQGHEVYILAGNYCHNSFDIISEPYHVTQKVAYYDKVPFIWFDAPIYKKNSMRRIWNMLVFAYNILSYKQINLLPRPDIIIGSSPSPFAAYAAFKLAKRFKIPFVYEIRDLWPETLLKLGKFSRLHPLVILLQKIENELLIASKKIISVLPGLKSYLEPKGIASDKIITIPNFADLNSISPSVIKPSDKITILYSGSFNVANDIETLLKAAKILQEMKEDKYQINLLGDGPKKEELQSLVKSQALRNVQILPMVSKEKVPDYLSQADILVGMVKNSELYQWGTSLNKMSDYFAAGRPVIFCINSPYDAIAEANAGLTVQPQNESALAQAIVKIGSMPLEARQTLGSNARRYAESYYNLDNLTTKLLAELQYLVQV